MGLIANNISADVATDLNVCTSMTSGNVTLGGTAQTGTIIVGRSTSSNTINVGNATTATGNTQTINVATAAAGTGKALVSIGNTNGASSLTLSAGTAGISISSGATGNIIAGSAATSGVITIGGTGQTGTITIGQSMSSNTICIGDAVTHAGAIQTVQIAGSADKSVIIIGSTSTSSALTLHAGTGAISIGTGAQARTTNIATGAAAQTVTLGSTTGASSTTIDAGTGAISIGTGAQARTTNIATGAAAQAVTLGSKTGASSLTLHSGTGHTVLDLAGNGNIAIAMGFTPTYGGGQNVIFIGNKTVNPSSNPTSGGIMFVDSGAAKWRGSSGTTTTFGPAGPHCSECGYDVWRIASYNNVWKSWHFECGNCGAVYKGGPVNVLDRLDEQEKKQLLKSTMTTWEEIISVVETPDEI